MPRRITPQQLSTVLFNWSKFPEFEALKNEPILCVDLDGEALAIDSLTLEEGEENGRKIYRMRLNTQRPPKTLQAFMGEPESDEVFLVVKSQTTKFHHR